MLACGVHLDRSTLTQWVHRVAALLEPIYDAQWESVLASSVLVMDETPIKAGRMKRVGHSPGKMKTGFFWPDSVSCRHLSTRHPTRTKAGFSAAC